MEKSQVVIEELASLCISAGLEAKADAARGNAEARGRLQAYYDVLDVLKAQADMLGITFADESVAKFDPNELLAAPKKAA